MEDDKNNQTKLLEMTIVFEMKNTRIGINNKLAIAEEK